MKEFDRPYLEAELAKVSHALSLPLKLYVIGGGAMALQGLKAGTKDLDVIVDRPEEADALHAALGTIAYKEPASLTAPYGRMGARKVLENADEFRWDIFVQDVMGFEFSDRMRTRSEPWMTAGPLTVAAASMEDVFTFKALTDRERDRDDMHAIFTAGVNTDIIREEVLVQAERPTGKRFAAFFYAGLRDYAENYGVLYPEMAMFARLYLREQAAEALVVRLRKEPRSISELSEEMGFDRHVVEEAVSRLVRQGLAKMDGGMLRRP